MISKALTTEQFEEWRTNFYSQPKNLLAQNLCSRRDPIDVCLAHKSQEPTSHIYSYKVDTDCKPSSKQRRSDRCWIYAALNCIRIPFAKKMWLDDFEFSQAYLLYWDKIEKCNYFLNNIINTAERGEDVDGRLVSFLLKHPTRDGGQWDMVVNIITKHGLMPKKFFPESYNSETSGRLNVMLKSKLREYAKILRDLYDTKPKKGTIETSIETMMAEVYKMVGICMGIPPESFIWEYYDKLRKYHNVGPMTPLEFYNTYVKPICNVEEKCCLTTDPRPTSSYGTAYTVDCLGNVVGGRPVIYNNQPVELLMEVVIESLKKNIPVWFGCEVKRLYASKQTVHDFAKYDFKLVFDVDFHISLSKADRLSYRASAMTHAMVFTAVLLNEDGDPIQFRVEHPFVEDRFHVITTDWFKEFVFQVVVDKSLLEEETLKVFEMEPIVLPAWDAMGSILRQNSE